ncbi:branched-chain amino acid ABC transporter permease [Neoroseomonas lacus]|uniref:Branched-chain amino acid ABC transporter permease n=1 Tax=Neoroseomonas lacus TaxID=287609 RepID=A0A917KDH6_9PROT|nr:branched-chain amino acid ABC transporter permease [Neoroseomonas lacus]GGJ09374.1 branched-chain amino acid ABC transporter permease [Neoroseomonas lacus]
MSTTQDPPRDPMARPARLMKRYEPILAILLAAAMITAAILAPWLRFVLTIALAKGIAVLGILLLLRAGQVSFGHAIYIAFGAYVVAFLAPTVNDAALLLALAAVGAGLLGLVIGAFVTRYRQIFFGMLNLAMSMVFYSLLEKLYAITKGSDGIRVEIMPIAGQALDRVAYEWVIFGIALGIALVVAILLRLYLSSPMGEALAGIKTRETRLEFMGVPARGVLLSAYVMSAVVGGIGGALIALTSRHVTPQLAYWTSSGELVFIAILGGAGGVLGPFLGAATYELVRIYAAASFADAWQMILGAVLLLVILFAPGGLWGMAARAIGGRGR